MKNILTLFIGGLITISAFAQDVTISFAGKKSYQVVLDGAIVNSISERNSSVSLDYLRPGRHFVTIYKSRHNKDMDNDDAVYSSSFIVNPNYDVFISINKRGHAEISQRKNNEWRNNTYDRHGRDNDRTWKGKGIDYRPDRNYNDENDRLKRF